MKYEDFKDHLRRQVSDSCVGLIHLKPEVVLSLLDEVEASKKEIDGLNELVKNNKITLRLTAGALEDLDKKFDVLQDAYDERCYLSAEYIGEIAELKKSVKTRSSGAELLYEDKCFLIEERVKLLELLNAVRLYEKEPIHQGKMFIAMKTCADIKTEEE